ncbi:proline-rich protein 11 isoform X4 [Gallus gallus]|uniref:proline-rich protein 11 isoform X4 n=1 Tax=Gallus gallus TaxID=9031 RepID=UPI000D63FABE|nr:proline-rich protein 11 isoform X4 [Gallus gallus]|eukprot:XP_024997762.1 proline-rich protein 11 isoform X3 [Gallus gallus]
MGAAGRPLPAGPGVSSAPPTADRKWIRPSAPRSTPPPAPPPTPPHGAAGKWSGAARPLRGASAERRRCGARLPPAAMAKHKQRRRKPRGRTKPGRRREAGAAASQPQLSAFHTTPPSAQRRTAAPRGRGDRSAAIRPGPAHLPPDAAAAAARASLCSLPLHGVKHVVKLLAAVAALLYCWCHSAVAQSFTAVKEMIFPSQVYLKELNAFKEQLEKLEMEFSRIQGILQKSGITTLSSESSHCQRCSKTVLGAPVEVQPDPPPSVPGPPAVQLQPTAVPPPLPPPPPPPPPPLPPPKLPAAPLLLKRGNGSKALLEPSVKKDAPMHITLKDLLNVKLRKTDSSLRTDKSVNLRSKSKPSAHVTSSLNTPPKNQLDLRKHLKKVNIQRSPGGTPLNKENTECGTGLTPIMTQALRRKFQMAHPKSPSPARLSAANSFDEHK